MRGATNQNEAWVWFGCGLVMVWSCFGHEFVMNTLNHALVMVWLRFGCVFVMNKEYFGHGLVTGLVVIKNTLVMLWSQFGCILVMNKDMLWS